MKCVTSQYPTGFIAFFMKISFIAENTVFKGDELIMKTIQAQLNIESDFVTWPTAAVEHGQTCTWSCSFTICNGLITTCAYRQSI